MEESIILFDKELRRTIEDTVADGGPLFGDLQWMETSLSNKFTVYTSWVE